MGEIGYQRDLAKTIRERLPGAFVLKPDPRQIQGFPDLLVLWNNRWGVLEVKMHPLAEKQANQDHYIRQLGEMSFASFIDPTCEEEVLNALESALRAA